MKTPVMDGWEFAGEFRKRYDHKAPVILVSAAGDGPKRAEETGATGWVGKTFDLDRLVETVAGHLSPN